MPEVMRAVEEMGRKRGDVVSNSLIEQRHYTITQLASRWGLGYNTVYRAFVDEPDVLRIGNVKSKKRTKITMRIPESVAGRVYRRLTDPTSR